MRDPETAELLCPNNHPFGSKRPPLDHYYYEAYNRANVSLVDVGEDPIAAINEQGLRLTSGAQFEFDMIVFATGFDAATGALTAIDIRGTNDISLSEAWRDGANNLLGVAVAGFPNMFMLGGPGFPFGNFPPTTEFAVNWVADAIAHLRETGNDMMEAKPDAVSAWMGKLQAIIDATVLGQGEAVRTWYLGANVPGKAHVPLFYLGGAPAYCADLKDCADNAYREFAFSRLRSTAPAAV